jgi:hypothetical protein
MSIERISEPASAFGVLQRFVRRGGTVDQCELCAAPLRASHQHLIEPSRRKLVCSCDACAILFSGQSGAKYKRVPTRVRFLTDFNMRDAQWESLMVPINMAFFFASTSPDRMIALYPSPAGATESLLPLETWDFIADANPILRSMEPDVEALLVNRLGPRRGYPADEYFLLPVDECFKLVGLVRTHWRGLSGGTEVWKELECYFSGLKERCGDAAARSHA